MTTAAQWRDSGLIPTSGLLAWHMFEAGVSGDEVIADYSGNGRIINTAGLNPPELTPDVLNGLHGWYFNGSTTDPLNWTGSITPKHVFILASAEEAAFTLNRGLLTGETSGDILVSEASGDEFFDLSFGAGYEYRKNDTVFAEAVQKAPVNGAFGLIEVSETGGFALDGIQVGQQRNLAGKFWKGYFLEQLLFNRVLTLAERRAVMLYFNIKYAQWEQGVPLYFPSSDMVTGAVRNRFYPAPRRWDAVTESYEFEDSNKTFNEFAGDPPHRWEYKFVNVSKAQTVLFDAFNDAARTANPFNFKDPEGYVWSNVRIDNYDRTHNAHKRWIHEVNFNLVGYNSTATYEG